MTSIMQRVFDCGSYLDCKKVCWTRNRFRLVTLQVIGSAGSQLVNSICTLELHMVAKSAASGYSLISSTVASLQLHPPPMHVLEKKCIKNGSKIIIQGIFTIDQAVFQFV